VHVRQIAVDLVCGSVNAALGGSYHLCHSLMSTKRAGVAAGRGDAAIPE
jgi:hypothetical protein